MWCCGARRADHATVRFLQQVPLLSGLHRFDIGLLARRMHRREFDPGVAVVTQGEDGDEFFLVLWGEADTCGAWDSVDSMKAHLILISRCELKPAERRPVQGDGLREGRAG